MKNCKCVWGAGVGGVQEKVFEGSWPVSPVCVGFGLEQALKWDLVYILVQHWGDEHVMNVV